MSARSLTFQARCWNSVALANAVHDLLHGRPVTGEGVFWDDSSQKWQIGIGNDWWLHPLGEGRWRLDARYDPTPAQRAALAEMLGWRLGLRVEDALSTGAGDTQSGG